MKNKYYNDAIIGGKNITASYSRNGELLRLIYPSPDYMQFIDYFETGVKINDSGIIYLHQDINNMYQQYYTEDTNILNSEIKNTYFNLKITQTDFVLLKNSVLVKKYTFENKNSIELNVNFLIHSKLLSDYNNMVGAVVKDNTLIQYTHNTAFCIMSNKEMLSYQLNDTKNNINSGEIADKDYIGMSPDSSISYNIGLLKPNEIKELVVYISIIENKNEIDLQEQIKAIKKIDTEDSYLKALKNCSSMKEIEKYKIQRIQGFINEYSKENTFISEVQSKTIVGNTPGEISLVYYKFQIQEQESDFYVLAIDQPEDDINPKRINKFLLKILSNIRDKKQVLIVTHNPMLVVNLDVDNVIYLNKVNNKLDIKYGALEYDEDYSILDLIKDNLDGGYAAIEGRLKKYDKDNN